VPQPVVHVANAVCWGIVVAVWIAGAVYNARHAPRRRRSTRWSWARVAAMALLAGVALATYRFWNHLQVDALWLQVAGLVILVASTAFALWARLSLGVMWSMDAAVKEGHELRTHGPYAVTRHPIYTGLLGMLLGSMLLSGIGRLVILFPAGLVLFELKLREEERLMLAAFPEAYPSYRKRVPRLVPRLAHLRRHP
jgi:protein-S-isoprenylcysteine O-methyltransferase Ste14